MRERLASVRLGDKDLDYVILTHLHSDHVSGLKQP
ncbi:MBL fold metallo-hydrolase [Paenibacillus sepulcri]